MQTYAGTKVKFSAVTDPSITKIPFTYNITLTMDNLRVPPLERIRGVKGLMALLEIDLKGSD